MTLEKTPSTKEQLLAFMEEGTLLVNTLTFINNDDLESIKNQYDNESLSEYLNKIIYIEGVNEYNFTTLLDISKQVTLNSKITDFLTAIGGLSIEDAIFNIVNQQNNSANKFLTKLHLR